MSEPSGAWRRRDSILELLPEQRPPSERVAEHAVAIIATVIVVLTAVGLATASVVQMDVTVSANGTLRPQVVTPVFPPEPGVVSAVYVRPGDRVDSAQVLYALDATGPDADIVALESERAAAVVAGARVTALRPVELATLRERERVAAAGVARARARLLAALVENGRGADVDSALRAPDEPAQVTLDVAKGDVREADGLLAVARLDLQRASQDVYDSLKARVDVGRATDALRAARAHRARLRVRAPVSGLVLTEQLDQVTGRAVSASQPVLELGSANGRWQAELLVSEADVRRVRVSDVTRLELVAGEGEQIPTIQGVVQSVGVVPWSPPGMGAASAPEARPPVYRVLVDVDAAADGVVPLVRGLTVRAHIRVRRASALRVLLGRLFPDDLRLR